MECFHRHVAPTVFAFLVVLCGTGTLEPARAQSTGGALGPTPSSLLLPSPTLANAQPVTNSSTQGAVLTSIASPAIGLPNQPGAEAVPSMGSQTPTYMGYTHRSRDLQPTASLQTPTGLPPFPFRPPVGLPFSRPRPPTGNPFLRPRPPPGNPFLRPGPPTGIPFLRPRPPPGNPFLRPGPPTGIPFLRLRPPPGNPFLVPRPPTGIPFLGPRPPSGFPLLPTRFCPPVGPHRLGPPGCPLSPHHPPTATSHPHPHDKSFPVFLPLPQSIFEAISTESFPTSIPVITQAPPTLQSVTSFLLNLTRWNCTPAVAVFDDEIGTDWNDQVHTIFLEHFQWRRKLQKFSCSNRCGSNERNAETIDKPYRSHPVRCFCDKLCVEFGDCCFDFFRMCRHLANPRRQIPSSNELCRSDKDRFGPRAIGYAVWSTCPKNWSDPIVHHKCQNENQSDLLNNLPVFDKDSRITYRNIFCARCNGAVNTRYWKLHADCKRWFNTTGLPLEDLMRIVDANCYMTIRISWLQYLKKCIPRFQDCSRVSQEKNDMNCQSQCLGYAFPVCVKENGKLIRYRNIQCALCNGIKPIYLEIDCIFGSWGPTPPLSILFDFTSSFQSSIEVIDRKMNMPRNIQQSWSCDPDEVYDPYTGKCKKIVDFYMEKASNGTQFVETELRNPEVVMENKTKLHLNCTFIAFNESDYLELPNGAVHVKPHHKVYGNTSYKIHANKLFLCVNFSRNATVLVVAKQHSIGYIKPAASPLQIMTSIGCIASMVSLILLLTTYTFFTELRNLPGRIIINLSLSLLFYQGVFLGAVKTVSHERCKIVAILLHFFVLSSFTWMNIMAYDVHKTFTSSGGGRGSSHQAQHTTRFVRYCLYGWGAPAIVVSTFVIIDEFLSKGFVGYGQGQAYCFIAEPKAILSSFIVPVALILVFNLFALVHTVLYIVKTRKRTHKVTNQQHSTGVALICVKMASVMGVTWILGIAANVHALSFLWYPYVVLNSLQGVFIFLSFAASGRSLELYRAKISILRNRCFQKASRNKERSKNIVKPSQKTWSLDSRDCEETPL